MNRKTLKKLAKLTTRSHRTDWLTERQQLAAVVGATQEHGTVAVVTNGMDCDGMRWCDVVHYMPAVPRAVERWLERFYDDAEGPQGATIMAPSVAAELRPEHTDLALRAFEDGHPHSIHY